MSWWVESGVLDEGDVQKVHGRGSCRTGLGTTDLEIYKVSLYSSLHKFTASWCCLMNAYNGGWMISVVLSDISAGNPQSTQPAVKVRQFYMLKLQCPCPISLCSESVLNTPILILPNKLNQRTGRISCQTHNSLSSQPARRSGHSEKSLVNWFRTWSVSDKHPETGELQRMISGGALGKFR